VFRRFFALIVLAALAAAGVYYWQVGRTGQPARSLSEVGDRLKDAALTGAVTAAFELNRGLAPLALRVTSEDGVVTLRGEVPTQELREEAARVAASVPDVRQVVDHMELDAGAGSPAPEGRSLGESFDDQALAAKVRLAFSLNRALTGTAISVGVYRREARLSGYVSSAAQKELAGRVAREVPGIEAVSDGLAIGDKTPAEAAPTGGRREAAARALRANPNLAPYAIEVVEEGGRLVLRGRVRTGAERDLAGLLAAQAAGGPVDNLLKIEAASG